MSLKKSDKKGVDSKKMIHFARCLASTTPRTEDAHDSSCARTGNISKPNGEVTPSWFTSQVLSRQADFY